jgi:hypothetical protein
VFFSGRYPETSFELVRDSLRLHFALYCYGLGLADRYPSFTISWNHGTIKGCLMAAAAVLMLGNYGSSAMRSVSEPTEQATRGAPPIQLGETRAAGPTVGLPAAAGQPSPPGVASPAAPQVAIVGQTSPGSPAPGAQRGTPVNQRLAIEAVTQDQTALRQYFSNVELVLVSVERPDAGSSLWNFSLKNNNTQDYIGIVPGDDDAYIVLADGRRAYALDWDGAEVRAGRQDQFTVGFAAPTAAGQRYRLVLNARAETGPSFADSDMRWAPVEVTLQ